MLLRGYRRAAGRCRNGASPVLPWIVAGAVGVAMELHRRRQELQCSAPSCYEALPAVAMELHRRRQDLRYSAPRSNGASLVLQWSFTVDIKICAAAPRAAMKLHTRCNGASTVTLGVVMQRAVVPRVDPIQRLSRNASNGWRPD